MFEGIKRFMRGLAVKKGRSTTPTSILPLKDIHTAVTFIDVEEADSDTCKNAIQAFYRQYDIRGDIFFFDFRKLESSELLITSINTTVLRKDLNWYDRPSRTNVTAMLERKPDLFISLIPSDSFPIHYMAACSDAKFKIGRVQLPGNIFDIVLEGTEGLSQIETFSAIRELLTKVQ